MCLWEHEATCEPPCPTQESFTGTGTIPTIGEGNKTSHPALDKRGVFHGCSQA